MPINNQKRIEALYKHLWSIGNPDHFALLDRSLHPRSPEMLYDIAEKLGVTRRYTVLDAGCGRGNHTCELANRFACHVMGVDLAENNLAQARTLAREAGCTDLVTFQQGNIETLPFENAMFDLIWCRDMLVHVGNLQQAISECVRVLKPGGAMLVHSTFGTDLLEPLEAARLYAPLHIVSANMSPTFFEETFQAVGFQMETREPLDGEWIEYFEEHEENAPNKLMRIARMRRQRERFVGRFGQTAYDVALALYHWHIYLLLGKLSSTIYTFRKSGN